MTSNPRAVADPDTFTVRRTITIAAPLEKVWTAVTDPEHISRWFGRTVLVGQGAGAHGSITWPGEDAIPLRVEAVDPPHSVSYRWCNDDARPAPGTIDGLHTIDGLDTIDGAPSTVFTFTLEATASSTRLTVEETGFELTSDPTGNLESHRQGWDGELDKLVSLLEGDPQ